MTFIHSGQSRDEWQTVEIQDSLDFEDDATITVEINGGDESIEFYLTAKGRQEMRDALAKLDGLDEKMGYEPEGFNEAAIKLAMLHAREISFQYQKAGGNVIERRNLVPAEVIESKGDHKIVVGYDVARDEPRAFRLDRILGSVVISG